MKRSRTRALSFLLTLAMVLSLLVVPATAVEVTPTKEWDLTGVTQIQNTTGTYDGLEIDATTGKWALNSPWVQVNNTTVIKVPVTVEPGKHAVIILGAYSNAFTVGGKANSAAAGSTGTKEYFDCADEGGYVTIKATANSYIDYLAVGYADGEVALEASAQLDADYADIADNAESGMVVTASVLNGAAESYTVAVKSGAAEDVVTTSVADDKITLTPAKVGDTTLEITANLTGGGTAAVELPVSVYDHTATTWDFMLPAFQKTANKNYRGLTLASANPNSSYGVGTSGNLTIPVAGASIITVVVGYTWNLSMADATVTTDNAANPSGDTSGKDVAVKFAYTGAAGVATLTCTGSTYIKSITVEEATQPIPTLTLDKDAVSLKLDGVTSAEVTATVENTDGAVTATSKNTAVATVSAVGDDGKFTITAVGAGSTTVEVTVAGTELKKTVSVKVAPAGTIYVKEKEYDFRTTQYTTDGQDSAAVAVDGVTLTGTFTRQTGNSHGLLTAADSKMELALEKKAKVTFTGCGYMTPLAVTEATHKGGAVTPKTVTDVNVGDGNMGVQLVFENVEGTLAVTFGGGSYIHSVNVEYLPEEITSADKRIQVWDFGGKVETDTGLYTNNITPDTLKNATLPSGDPLIVAGAIKLTQNNSTEFGNVAFAAGNGDKFFSNVADLAALAGGNAGSTHAHDFGDGYTSAGGFITNGGGNGSRRNVTVKGVRAGETVTVYLSNNQSDTTYEVEGHAELPKVTVKSREFGVMSFVAPETGSYKIWANGGKPGFLRLMVVPTVTVTGSITLPADFDAADWGLKFVDPTTKAVTEATVDKTAKTYTVELAPGKSYNASLTSATGWGMTVATKSVALVNTDITTGKTHDLTVEKKEQYTYSGSITGFAQGYDTSKLVITMIPDADSVANAGAEEVELTLTGMDFTATLDPSVVYTLDMKGVNDYAVKAPAEVTSEGEALAGQTIEVEAKPLVAAAGKFVALDVDDQFAPLYADSAYEPLDATVTALVFENVDDGYAYPATVSDGGYTVSLRAGSYLAKATVDGYSTKTHVVVGDQAAEKDLLFVSTATPAAVDYAADIYVGDATKTPNFKTVTGALAYIKRMTRTDGQRVTVHIAPGIYREQINIDVANVTFVNDAPGKEVKLSWYYGIGYTYYSAKFESGTECWYDPELAFDRYAKADADVSRWGATVRVRAPGFQAENITFENSFNYYITDEEIADGVAPNEKQTIRFAREYGADVKSKAATERAAALWVDTNNGRGDMTEFKSCKLLSSQDTLGTGKRMYFKDCYIEGMTDFICGPGDVVFDTCTLNWKGYSESPQGGYLTAPQTGAAETGYLFRNCYISGDTKLQLGGGAMGRTWGAENTGCIFLNTTLQSAGMITEPTWIDMQNFDADQATKIHEWGTMLLDGTKVDLSKRQNQNTVLTSEPTIDVKGTYFKDWTPAYYVEEAATVAFTTDPYITDNGDINIPYPGHTLTVHYSLGEANDANDASVIQWYAVKDGTETLVKSSFANADKTYKIQAADVGAQIKVTVTPTTLSGKTGEAKSMTVAETVKEGYDDPSNPVDPELGDGVNIFLAGDSTVKHYGAVGMHQNGKIGKEGSWGEFFQDYFNQDLVTVVNYANGGRSTRNFINEGSLDKIAQNIKEGDYLLIQFGHNDCANDDGYREDRYVPLGTPDQSGVYPSTPGVKGADGKYTWDCGGTYKWYLQQYIDVAKDKGAIPVLVTPVARMYYTSDGSIRPHHDASLVPGTEETTKTTNTDKSNTYCAAVRQLAQEQDVLLIDGYALTAKMYEDAYKAAGNDTYGQQVMAEGDKTHSNKLGGMVEAALIAQTIQGMELNISKTVKAPAQLTARTSTGETAFTINGEGKLTAYDMLKGYAETAPYWMGEGQKLFDAIAAKAEELNGGSPDDPAKPADKTALTAAVTAAEKKAADTYTVSDGTAASEVSRGTKFVTESDKAALTAAIAAAKAVADKADATDKEIAKAVADLKAAVETFDAAIQTGTKSSGGYSSGGTSSSGSTTTVTNPDGSKTTTKTDRDGTVTETTLATDGSKVETVTTKDGDVTIAVTDADGETLAQIDLPATIPAPATKFVDVPDDHWAAKSINDMAGLGMVKGVSENTFDMTSPMTRGAIATIFFRLSNGKEGKSVTFADVAKDAWYADAVGWAAGAKLITGYDETTFGPDDTITRQQLAVMIARYAKLLGLDTTADAAELSAFSDGASTDSWAVDGMAWCVKAGVMHGRGDGTVDPKTNVTRAEAAAMLDRAIGLLK